MLKKTASVLCVWLICTFLFAIRYLPAFQQANFYAEDGTVFIQSVYDEGNFGALIQPFNGYLVVGQSLLASFAVALQTLLGLQLYELPLVIAVLSCLLMGLVFSLPFLLYRKEMGVLFAALASILGALMPMPGSDYAIVGTIGNTKFMFLYVAFLFILYRNLHYKNSIRVVISDSVLLLCVLTNVSVILLLPFALWPYRQEIFASIRIKRLSLLAKRYFVSLMALYAIAGLYVVTALMKGIPALPGYLDSSYKPVATLKILYRVTLYAWTFPMANVVRGWMVLSVLSFLIWLAWRNKRNRFNVVFGLWSILASTALFVVNRPGISDFYVKFQYKTTDQFFYAQGLIFVFVTILIIRIYYKKNSPVHRSLLAIILSIFVACTVPLSSSFGRNVMIYKQIGTAETNIIQACSSAGDTIPLVIYPAENWVWSVDKDRACD